MNDADLQKIHDKVRNGTLRATAERFGIDPDKYNRKELLSVLPEEALRELLRFVKGTKSKGTKINEIKINETRFLSNEQVLVWYENIILPVFSNPNSDYDAHIRAVSWKTYLENLVDTNRLSKKQYEKLLLDSPYLPNKPITQDHNLQIVPIEPTPPKQQESENIHEFFPEDPLSVDSWTIINSNIAVKRMDRSSFIHNGTGIPKDKIRNFFNLQQDILAGYRRSVKLKYRNKSYPATLRADIQPNPRTQLLWHADFEQLIQSFFPSWYQHFSKNLDLLPYRPEMHFEKTEQPDEYSIEFVEPISIEHGIPKIADSPAEGKQVDLNNQTVQENIFQLPTISQERTEITSQDSIDLKNEERRKENRNLSLQDLKQRLKTASNSPTKRTTTVEDFIRNQDVVDFVKEAANGICQLCDKPAPFIDKNGDPFLHAHHIVWLNRKGDDKIGNAVALCPNCHAKMHILDLIEDVEKLTKIARNHQ